MSVDRVHVVSLLLFNLCATSTLSKESLVYFVCPTEIPQLPFAWKYYLPGPLRVTVPGPTNWTGECVCVKKEHTSMSHVILSLHLFISRNVRLDTVTWKKNLFPVEIHIFAHRQCPGFQSQAVRFVTVPPVENSSTGPRKSQRPRQMGGAT